MRVKCSAASLYKFYFALGVSDVIPLLLANVLWKNETHLTPGEAARSQVYIYLPWMVKPLIGFWTDRISINGRNRTPYIYFFLPLIIAGWTSVQFLEFATQNDLIVLILSFTNFATVFVDVVYDGVLCEFTKEAEGEGDHGTYQANKNKWRSMGGFLGGILNVVTLTAEEHTSFLNVKTNMALIPIFYLWVWVDAIVHMSEDQGDPEDDVEKASEFRRLWRWCGHNPWATLRDSLHTFMDHRVTKLAVVVFAIAAAPHVGMGLQFFFLDTTVGLGIRPKTLSYITVVTELFQVLASILYEKTLKYFSFRSIMLMCILFGTVGSLLPIVLTERWNVALGIPDWLFLATDESFMAVVIAVVHIPIQRETAKNSHKDWMATTYAAIAALENGTTMAGIWFGAAMMDDAGLDGTNYDNLSKLLLVCGALGLIAIPFVYCAPNLPGAVRGASDSSERRAPVENMDEEDRTAMMPLHTLTSSTKEKVHAEDEVESLIGTDEESDSDSEKRRKIPLHEIPLEYSDSDQNV